MKASPFQIVHPILSALNPSQFPQISVLKHLQLPLKLLQTQNNLQFPSPQCLYGQKLQQLSQDIFPTVENTKQVNVQQTKLLKMEYAESQFLRMKKNFQKERYRTQDKEAQKTQNHHHQNTKTLYNMFYFKTPYYCRFQNHHINKNNFANMFVKVGGVNLQAKINKNYKAFPNKSEKRFNTGSLIFDSNFQSGNLLYVYQQPQQIQGNNDLTYNLILHNDTNTYGHNQWFFFRVKGNRPHLNVKFNIINLIKSDSLFNYGLKPLVFSQKQQKKSGIGWLRRGENIRYYQNSIRRQNKKQFYYTLSFQFVLKQSQSWTYFAPSYPYTYSQLCHHLCLLYTPSFRPLFSFKTLSQTLGNNKINLITISTGILPIQECKVVWILARQHPGETTSSFMVEGVIKYLLHAVSQAKNGHINGLHKYVFKIIPMVNADGVIHGNSRAGLIGLDPNRSWKKPRKTVNPDNWHIIKEIMTYKSNISMILDLHSHSKKTGCFFYGNQVSSNSKIQKIYPTLVCQNDQRFCLKNCRFRGGYKTTLRHMLFSLLPIQNIYTVQCSLLGYSKNNRVIQYTIQDYHQMGAKLVQNYLKLQNIKLITNVNDIIKQYDQKIGEIVQVDSARSQSSVSDDQYQEIRDLEKGLVSKKYRSANHKVSKTKLNQSLVFGKGKNKNKLSDYHSTIQKKQKCLKTQSHKTQISLKRQNIKQIRNRSHTMNQQKYKPQQYPQQTPATQPPKLSKSSTPTPLPTCLAKNLTSKQIPLSIPSYQSQSIQVCLPIKMTPKSSSLIVCGNPCQNQFTVYKNQVNLQVNWQAYKSKMVVEKLPRLMNLVNRKYKRSYKQNCYQDDDKPSKTQIISNIQTKKDMKTHLQRFVTLAQKNHQ